MENLKKILLIVFISIIVMILIHNILLDKEIENTVGKYIFLENYIGRINIYDSNKGSKIIVFLSGFGTGSPIIDYLPITNKLKDKFRIIVIESYGYGFSDDTKIKRSVENIVEEIHSVLINLEIDKYTILAHSISGIYAQFYIEKYRNEIESYIGIENMIPQYLEGKEIPRLTLIDRITRRSGIIRLLGIAAPAKLIDEKMKNVYSQDKLKELKRTFIRNYKNKAQLSEIENYQYNVEKVSDIIIDKELPTLFIVSRNDHDNPEKWIEDHERMIKTQDYGILKEYVGSHYLHHEKYEEISKNIEEFMEKYI